MDGNIISTAIADDDALGSTSKCRVGDLAMSLKEIKYREIKFKSTSEPKSHARSQRFHSSNEPSNDRRVKGNRMYRSFEGTRELWTKENKSLSMKLKRIQQISLSQNVQLNSLMSHFTADNLKECFYDLDRNKAVGVDGITWEKYKEDLDNRIELLVTKLKRMSYRPSPVKEVLIPKDNGSTRPLAISNIEDKIIQSMYAKLLNAIYDANFLDFSYGFRPNKSSHQAIKRLRNILNEERVDTVIDIDLENFFGEISHEKLIAILEMKIKDERFIQYLKRMLKVGFIRKGKVVPVNKGVPQGSICSPILANIFAHYCLDKWIVNLHLKGKIQAIRFADDLVIICSNSKDSRKVLDLLEKRLQRCDLKLNSDKTRVVKFNCYKANRGEKSETFDFLGFTFYIGKMRSGYKVVMVKTAGKKYRAKLQNVKAWCRKTRAMWKLKYWWGEFCQKLGGHIAYYGVSFNIRMVRNFIDRSIKIFYKWMLRRSEKRKWNWRKFGNFMKQNPIPRARIYHKLF